jgi:hypothetical protein
VQAELISGEAKIWSAATCRRFSWFCDSSPNQSRVQRDVAITVTEGLSVKSARPSYFRRAAGRGTAGATRRSGGHSGDRSPHSKASSPPATVLFNKCLHIEEIKKLRFESQFLFKHKHPFVREHLADF